MYDGDGSPLTCGTTGKICYTQAEAGKLIGFFKKSRCARGTNMPSRYYVCPFCGAYHLTHYRNKRGPKNSRRRLENKW